ncbi:MAG: hypothetical protein SFV52_07805 [Saprospiraceae bacterium]|nr:hypothetical protein [Saprospiraceae bacterium]
MRKITLFLSAFALVLVAMNACQKDDATPEAAFVAATEDAAAAEDFSEQTDVDIDLAVEDRGSSQGCPVVTFAQPWGTWPNTITIDYGDNCVRPDGRVLKGKIIVNQSNELTAAGATRMVTYDNFFIDDVQVLGAKSWINNGPDAQGLPSYTKTAQNMQLLFADGASITWNTNRTSTLVEGAGTPTFRDNVWQITGASSGVNRNGESYTATITEPLVKSADCRWISQGVFALTRDGRTATLDFGDGACDRWANLTVDNGTVVTIRLRR